MAVAPNTIHHIQRAPRAPPLALRLGRVVHVGVDIELRTKVGVGMVGHHRGKVCAKAVQESGALAPNRIELLHPRHLVQEKKNRG